jgi:hypothetical protein
MLMSSADLRSCARNNSCPNSGASALACASPQMTKWDPSPCALGQRQALAPAGASRSQVASLLQAGWDLLAARSWLTDARAGALNVHRLARSARSSRSGPARDNGSAAGSNRRHGRGIGKRAAGAERLFDEPPQELGNEDAD